MVEFIQQYWLGAIFGAIISLFGFGYKKLSLKIAKKNEKEEFLYDGVKALLFDRLRQAYNFHIKNGFIAIDDYNYFHSLYDSYHKLGGNGTGTEMLSRLKELPATSLK